MPYFLSHFIIENPLFPADLFPQTFDMESPIYKLPLSSIFLLLFVLLIPSSFSCSCSFQDLLLGGLFPIHKQGQDGQACGDIQDEDGGPNLIIHIALLFYITIKSLLILHIIFINTILISSPPAGIQPLEALLFTLDEINKNPRLLPNISLGLVVRYASLSSI